MGKKYTKKTFAAEILMVALAFVFVIPVYYLVVSTFKGQQEIMEHPLALPAAFTLENYSGKYGLLAKFRKFSTYNSGICSSHCNIWSNGSIFYLQTPDKIFKISQCIFSTGIYGANAGNYASSFYSNEKFTFD